MILNRLLTASACCLALTGCGGHDREYYEHHPDEARQKYDECVEKISQAFAEKDGKTIQKLYNDNECTAAGNAVESSKGKNG